jgi:hypothetical protein
MIPVVPPKSNRLALDALFLGFLSIALIVEALRVV